MKRLLVVLVSAGACGGSAATPDAARDASTRCTAVFAGNFAETSSSDACAMAGSAENGDVQLTLTVPSQVLNSDMVGTFDLGPAPTPGAYSSRTVVFWRMRAAQRIGQGSCLYAAGTLQVPQGSFDLQITSLDAETMHGTLDLTQFILGFPSTDCGDIDTEHLTLSF